MHIQPEDQQRWRAKVSQLVLKGSTRSLKQEQKQDRHPKVVDRARRTFHD